jgi:hypothetical protein
MADGSLLAMNTKEKWSVRKKSIYAMAIATLNFFGFIILATSISNFFAIFAVGAPFICGILLLSLRCPVCGQPMYKRKIRIFGEEITYWGGFLPKRCSKCGNRY